MPYAFEGNMPGRGKNALIGYGYSPYNPQQYNPFPQGGPGSPAGGIQLGQNFGGMPFEGGMYQGGKFGASPYQPYQPGGIPQGGIPFEGGYQPQSPQQMPMGVNQMRMIWGNYRRPGMMGIRQKY